MQQLDLNAFRLDVDEAMSDAQEAQYAAEADRQEVRAAWQRIATELARGGPFATMLMSFRSDATRAMSELVYADPADAKAIAALQADVQRTLRTMEHIDEFRNAADAADANIEGEELSVEE